MIGGWGRQLGAAIAAISLSGGALAADLPLKAPPKAVDFNPFWAEADYLAWSVSGDKLPALVTTAPVGTPLGVAGVLGQPTTTVLFGDSSVNKDWRRVDGSRPATGSIRSAEVASRPRSSGWRISGPALRPIPAPPRS